MTDRTADVAFAEFRRSGDPTALADAFDRTAPELLRVAAFLAPAADVEDLVHDCFVTAIDRSEAFDPARPVLPWLLGILANEARSLRRRRRMAQREADARPPGEASDPVEAARTAEIRGAFAGALQRLDRDQAQLLQLHLEQELSCREIGERLERPAGTVRTQVSRAMGELRRRLPVALGAAPISIQPAAATLDALRQRVLERTADPAAAGAARSVDAQVVTAGLSPRASAALLLVVAIAIGAAIWGFWPTDATAPPAAASTTAADRQPDASTALADADLASSPSAAGFAEPDRDEPAPTGGTATPAPWVLAGRVHRPDGAPIPGAVVTGWVRFEGPIFAKATADDDGRYELDLSFWRDRPAIDRSRYALRAVASAPASNDYNYLDNLPADADPQRPLRIEHDFELDHYATLSGRVVDADGRPVAAQLTGEDRTESESMHGVTTAGEDGRFHLVFVADGVLPVHITAWHPVGGRRALDFEVEKGEDLDVGDVVLDPGHRVTGRLTLADGTPVPDWQVSVGGGSGPPYWYCEPRTDENGRFVASRPTLEAWHVSADGVRYYREICPKQDLGPADDHAELVADAVLVRLAWLDPEGRRLLPGHGWLRVFAAEQADVAAAAQAGDQKAMKRALSYTSVEQRRLLVPCGSHLLLRSSVGGGFGVDRLVHTPARSCVMDVELQYAPMPAAELTVNIRFADGGVPEAFECNVNGAAGTRSTDVIERGPGMQRVRCGVGEVTVDVTAYPTWLDNGFEQRRLTTTDGGSHELEVVLQRRGRVALTLRDAADPERATDEDVDAVVTAGDLTLERFQYDEGEYEVTSSQPPIGTRVECLTLLPVGRQELKFAVDGFAPTTAVAEVQEDELAELTVWLQKAN